MVPLAHAHRATGFFDGDVHIELGEGLDKNLRGREGAEVDHSAGPIEDDGLEGVGILVIHDSDPVGKEPVEASLLAKNLRAPL